MAETVLPPKINDVTVTLSYSFTWDSVVYSTGAYYGYCTVADVNFEFPNNNGFTTKDNSTVAQEIAGAAIELHEALAVVYGMPYSGTNQGILIKLRDMNAKLAFARLVERYFTANSTSANHSEAAAAKAGWVNHQIEQLVAGDIRWDAPFGDATVTARTPVFSHAAAATVMPNPDSGDMDNIFSLTPPGTRQGNRFNGM